MHNLLAHMTHWLSLDGKGVYPNQSSAALSLNGFLAYETSPPRWQSSPCVTLIGVKQSETHYQLVYQNVMSDNYLIIKGVTLNFKTSSSHWYCVHCYGDHQKVDVIMI